MTNPNKTSITVILDKSGSMHPISNDTIGGYNKFIETQRNIPGECEISLIQFSSNSEFTYKSKPINEAILLNNNNYMPNGGTALLDAIGTAIIEKGKELSNLAEDDRPSKVMFVIITDGEENSSKEFRDRQVIKDMIEHQKTVYSWDFTFLGANQDVFTTSTSLGIDLNKSLSFSTTKSGGAMRAFAAIADYSTSARTYGTKAACYSDVQRKENS